MCKYSCVVVQLVFLYVERYTFQIQELILVIVYSIPPSPPTLMPNEEYGRASPSRFPSLT